MPIRNHVRISHQGTAEKYGKFDEEIVFKGCRFCFEIEFLGRNENDSEPLNLILSQMLAVNFRIGGGTRSGFGKVKVVETRVAQLDLQKKNDLDAYLQKSSNLSDTESFWGKYSATKLKESSDASAWTKYELSLKPVDFFLFGSGSGDDDADMCNAMGTQIEWRDGKPSFTENLVLIPGSSVKGAVSHRVAFHYNKLTGVTAEKLKAKAVELGKKFQDMVAEYTGDKNEAVEALFGSHQVGKISRGSVLISDIMKKGRMGEPTKILNHVSVDRFTGGAIDGALFSEKPWVSDGENFTMEFVVENSALADENIKKAFELALKDLTDGLLSLGGGVNRGHGVFKGSLKINGEVV